ncbi:MAG: DUF1573 domain-containing protein [Phycisphaerales bacterium]
MPRCTSTFVAALSLVCSATAFSAPLQSGAPAAPAQGAPAAPAAAPPVDTGDMIDALPPIKLTPDAIDLGFMAPKAGGRGTVTLTNTGTKPLKIAAITPSCKCTTTTDLAGTVIEPGKSASLEAVLEGASMPQSHRASIRVLVDGYARVLEIQLRGETAMPVRAVPPLINAVEGKAHQGRFVVESIDKKPFTICAVGGRQPEYIGFNPGEAPRNTYLVKYDLDTWQPTYPNYLVVETDRADCPVFDVWIRSETTIPRSVLRMKEYRVNAGRIPMGGSSDVTVELEDLGDEILAVESLSPEIQVQLLGQSSDGKTRRLPLRITPKGPQQGLIYGQMRIYTRDKEQDLYVFGSVRPTDATGCQGCRADKGPSAGAPAPTPKPGAPVKGAAPTAPSGPTPPNTGTTPAGR